MQGSVSELNEYFYLVLVPASIYSAPTTRWGKAFRAYGLFIMRTYRINNQICTQEVMASREPRIKYVRRNTQCD